MGQFKLFSTRKKPRISHQKTEKTEVDAVREIDRHMGGVVALDSADMQVDRSRELSFTELGLSKWLVSGLQMLSIKRPTEVQRACIPHILAGKNAIASAKTGSGKTAAFALPIIQKLSEEVYGGFAVVLTPTRELAFQIAEQFRALGEGISIRLAVVVGGMDMMKQVLELERRPHIIVATPGRLADHIKSNPDAVFLKKLRFLVLDEADRMLEETFADDLEAILGHMPSKRQTLLFSATMTKEIQALADEKTFRYSVIERHDTVAKLDQRYIMVPSMVRDSYLVWILSNTCKDSTAIIFTGKCVSCELLRFMLIQLGFNVTALHSEMTQSQRINSLARFRSGVCKILVSTDVGSRGLDIPEVQYVVNFDIPCSATDYVHRVGRTARAGRGGKAISLVGEMDVDLILNIERKLGGKLDLEEVVEKEIHDQLKNVAEAKQKASAHLVDIRFGEKTKINAAKGLTSRKSLKRRLNPE